MAPSVRSGTEDPARETARPVPARVVVGLGNPGPKYRDTRHNIGFRVIESIAARHGAAFEVDTELDAEVAHTEIAGLAVALLAPQTYVNRSGVSVGKALERWPHLDPEQDLLIVYDEMDLPTGRIRLRTGGGPGGHNGMGDIIGTVDSRAVPRLRFGVSRPAAGADVVAWVLGPFSEEEEEALPEAIDWAADAIAAALESGVGSAMNRFNADRPSGTQANAGSEA